MNLKGGGGAVRNNIIKVTYLTFSNPYLPVEMGITDVNIASNMKPFLQNPEA